MEQTGNRRRSTLKLVQDAFSESNNREVYLPVAEFDFDNVITALAGRDIVLIALFAAENIDGHNGFTLFYVLEKRGSSNIVILKLALSGKEAISIAGDFASACWFEREIRDGFGIEFPNAFDKRRLFLHEVYPDDFHPLLKSFHNVPTSTRQTIAPSSEYQFKEMTGEGVYQIPVGPVHAGIIEPGHFRFSVIGETIFNLEIRMFYKHRGIEKLAEGKTPEQCVGIAETISGDESVANAVGFSLAIEKVCGANIPARAWQLRTILLELERIYSHLGDMAGMVVDVAFPRGASRFFILREEILRQNALLTGSRFMKGIVTPGGLKKDIPPGVLARLAEYLAVFRPRFDEALNIVHSSSSVVDRLETTGVIRPELVNALNITGPAARAGGVPIDTRRDHPYGIYAELEYETRKAEKSDVMSRFNVKSNEILDSVSMIRNLVNTIQTGDVSAPLEYRDGYALALVETARGQSLHWVNLKDRVIDRYKVRTASFCNWQAIEQAVLGNIVPDFPLINKSLNLSYAGTDL
jgi:formate hydrogenlyase subunit 5